VSRLATIAREPLAHFLLAGGALFAIFALFGKPAEAPVNEIRVTRGQVASLSAAFKKTWLRDPNPSELSDLVDEFVREEIYCREAIALGLDKDDAVIRRRLRQKMEFLAEDASAPVGASDGDPNARRLAAAEAAYRSLRAKYTVTVERP
jgi:hypothetical protein